VNSRSEKKTNKNTRRAMSGENNKKGKQIK
jgi:hypothetical protein